MRLWFRCLFAALVVVVAAAHGRGFIAGTGQSSPSGVAKPHGIFQVELIKALDSKKLKQGGQVESKLTNSIILSGGESFPRGAIVIGHVTEAKARAKNDSESILGIRFEKVVPPTGESLPIRGVVLAAAPNPYTSDSSGTMPNAYPSLDTATTASIASTMTAPSIPILNTESRGVLGIPNLELRPDGMFASNGKTVKIESGARLLLDVTIEPTTNN